MTPGSISRRRRSLAAVAVVVAVVTGVVAVVAGVVLATRPATATGIVTHIDQPSLTDIRSFTLHTSDGQTLTFHVGTLEMGGDAFPPGHLTSHLVTAEPVLVTYHREGDTLVATRLEDAPP